MRLLFSLLFISIALLPKSALANDTAAHIKTAIDGEHRSAANKHRDQYRHPLETLLFFKLDPAMTVVEIWPSRGWYTEILAPVLREKGTFYAAGFGVTANKTPQWRLSMAQELQNTFIANPALYDRVINTELSIPERPIIAPANSADLVLTFRNVHNWMKGEYASDVFTAMYRATKPGGLLGVVEHRAKPGTDIATMIKTGYVTEAYVKQLAQAAGYSFLAASEVNANPKDTTDHPKGVWTLPPSLRLGEEKREHYLEIGESDRMTLLFQKTK